MALNTRPLPLTQQRVPVAKAATKPPVPHGGTFWQMPVRTRQQFLRSHGFNVTLDGKPGPQTFSASWAWEHGINPQTWASKGVGWQQRLFQNYGPPHYVGRPHGESPLFGGISKAVKSALDGSKTGPIRRPSGGVDPNAPTSSTDGKVPSIRTTPAPGQDISVNPLDGMPMGGGSGISPTTGADLSSNDPMTYASAINEVQYGPQLAALMAQIKAQNQKAADAQASIASWYNVLGGDLANAQSSDDAAAAQALGDQDRATQGVLNVLGGNGAAAGSAATFGGIERANLEGEHLAQHAYDQRLGPAYRQQGIDDRRRQLMADRAASDSLSGNLASLLAQKSSDLVKGVYDARHQNLEDRIAQKNMETQDALLPYQIADAKLGIAGKKAGLKAGALQYDLDKLRLSAGLQQLAQSHGASGAVPKFGDMDPGQLSGLQNQLLGAVVDAHNPSKLAIDPIRVYNAWGNSLRGLSNGAWDPKTSTVVRTWRNNLLSSYLPQWNANHPNLRYSFKNGTLIRLPDLGKKKAPKKH